VGHERGAHTLDRNHEVVFEGDEILYVGPAFEGRVDREIDGAGQLVVPGFIDTQAARLASRAGARTVQALGPSGACFGRPCTP
jgi:hypothetical protein